MTRTTPCETETETLDHIRFQVDLLKLMSMPVELTGPSVMRKSQQSEAARVVTELVSSTDKSSQR